MMMMMMIVAGRMVATDTADFFVVVESDQASYKGQDSQNEA